VFKGKYKKKLSDGSLATYSTNDVVMFHGKLYAAKEPVSLSPLENTNSWNFVGSTEIFNSDNPPLNAEIGQIWVKDGIYYSYYYDGNNYAWVAI
jgi:hypothetical protein